MVDTSYTYMCTYVYTCIELVIISDKTPQSAMTKFSRIGRRFYTHAHSIRSVKVDKDGVRGVEDLFLELFFVFYLQHSSSGGRHPQPASQGVASHSKTRETLHR